MPVTHRDPVSHRAGPVRRDAPDDAPDAVPPAGSSRHAAIAPVIAALVQTTAFPDELRQAVAPTGALDRVRFGMTIVGVTAFARHHACTPREVRRVVGAVVRESLPSSYPPAVRERSCARAVGFVDALYLTFGRQGFEVDFLTACAAIPGVVDERD